MDVAEEASAPEPVVAKGVEEAPIVVEAATTLEAATVAESPPEAPQAVPVEPAPAPIQADDEPLPFQPSLFRRVIVAPFWAGLLGCGTSLWIGGLLGALIKARLLERLPEAVTILLVLVPSFIAAMAWGFRAPLRSYAGLVGRVVGAFLFGAALAMMILVMIFEGLRLRNAPAFMTVALVGALLAGLALARVHGIAVERSRRIRIGAGVAAVLFVTSWPATPSLRCWLGFGEGCRLAAMDVGVVNDPRAAGELAARGCAREDSGACRLAGQAYQVAGPARDLDRAEGFFREGCALGDPESCDRVHAIELERRCDRYGAFACAELAQAHESGDGAPRDPALAKRYFRKACLLGADDACREGRGR